MSASNEPLIHLEGVSKVFITDELETHALSDIDINICRGDYVSISGPSGCGKTTLLSVMGLLDSHTTGSYWLNGRLVEDMKPAERAQARRTDIGFIFQSFNLIGSRTAFENVELPLTYRRISPAERKRRAHEALDKVGMSHRAGHRPNQLSGGQQQRVAVARAVAGDPLILLADEPTGNLDSNNSEDIMKLLDELHRHGATICLVTHDPRHANHADRTIHLFDGQMITEATRVA